MSDAPNRHFRVARRDEERVSPLELILDVVFVLAITQCTALIAHDASWESMAEGLLVLAVLWRGWVGFAWLTSAVDPEEHVARFAVFVAMAGFLVLSLSITEAFGELGLLFACAYAVVRLVHLGLGLLASTGDERFRSTVQHNAIGGAVGIALLVAAAFLHGWTQVACWALAIIADFGIAGTYRKHGWKLVPGHFAERHGLIMIIALGESVLAIGVGAQSADTDTPTVAIAVLGVFVVACLWWAYFDGVAGSAERRLVAAPAGPKQDNLARFGYSLLHLPMIAGDILIAVGLKATIAHRGDPFEVEMSTALYGGLALYLLALVAFRLRVTRTLNRERLAVGVVLLALIPLGVMVPSWVSVVVVAAMMAALLAYETRGGRALPQIVDAEPTGP